MQGSLEDRCGEGGDGEVPGGGAVAVVAQGQPRVVPGVVLFGADQVVLVGVDDRFVGFDPGQRPSAGLAEGGGVHQLGFVHQHRFDLGSLTRGESAGELPDGMVDHRRVVTGDTRRRTGRLLGGGEPPVQRVGEFHRSGGIAAGAAGGLGEPGAGVGVPGPCGHPRPLSACDQPEFHRFQAADRPVDLDHRRRIRPRRNRRIGVDPADRLVDLRQPHTQAGRCG